MPIQSQPIVKLLVLFCISLLVAGCDRAKDVEFYGRQSPGTGKAPKLAVNVMKATRESEAIETAVFFGTLTPNRQSQLRFGQSGRVKNFLVDVGQVAKSGERIAELDLEQLEKQKTDLEESILEARQGFQPNEQNILQLESQLQRVQLELNKGYLVAPYDCIVASLHVVAGDLVSMESPAVSVVEELPVMVKANFPLEIAQGLSIGQSVWIAIGEQSLGANVKTISPVESTVGSKIVSLQIIDPLPQSNWSFGQTVKIRFFVFNNTSGYWLPSSALSRESSGLWSTLVVAGDSATIESGSIDSEQTVSRKMLKLIQLEDEWALVDGALVENELVIVNGSHRVVPGQLVKVVDVTEEYPKPGTGDGE